MRRQGLVLGGVLLLGALSLGCTGDPNDPKTWAKKLGNLREQKEALDHIASMDVEKARAVVPELMALYKETRNPEHLQALVRYQDERTKPLFIEALDYTDEDFDKATMAAGVLGDMKAVDAVDKLIAAAEKELPVKSRANNAKLAAMRALVRIGDKRAVPTLVKVLTTSADEQDFVLNQKAALGLAELRDPASIPALLKGLFMTGRGADIFQECRLGLVRIGAPAIPPVLELFQDRNADIRAMAQTLKFKAGIVPYKAAYLLGDLRAVQAVPVMTAYLKGKPKGEEFNEHSAIVIALGQIGTPAAVDALIAIAKDGKADPKLRLSATDALYMSGDRRAVPTLMDLAKSGYVTIDGTKASDLRANAAIDLARIAGAEHYAAFSALVEKETEAQGMFGEALDRMHVAKECQDKLPCLGKALTDPSWTRAEKAAFAIGFSGDKAGIPMLLGALKPLAALAQERYPVHQAVLFALTRLADKSCKECDDRLQKQIERDEKAVRLPGARGLLAETRVAMAIIQNSEPGGRAKPAAGSAPEPAPAAGGGKKGGKGGGKKVATRKGKRK
jgi:HEAT repeat protein